MGSDLLEGWPFQLVCSSSLVMGEVLPRDLGKVNGNFHSESDERHGHPLSVSYVLSLILDEKRYDFIGTTVFGEKMMKRSSAEGNRRKAQRFGIGAGK